MGVIWYKMDKWPHSNIKDACLLVEVKEDHLVLPRTAGKGLIHPIALQGAGAGSRSAPGQEYDQGRPIRRTQDVQGANKEGSMWTDGHFKEKSFKIKQEIRLQSTDRFNASLAPSCYNVNEQQ